MNQNIKEDSEVRKNADQQQKKALLYLGMTLGTILGMPLIRVFLGSSRLSLVLYLLCVTVAVLLVRRGSQIWTQAQRRIDELNRRNL